MSTLSEIASERTDLTAVDVDWLQTLVGDLQMLADLDHADVMVWLVDRDGACTAAAHARPSGRSTLFFRDQIGRRAEGELERAIRSALDGSLPDTVELLSRSFEDEGASVQVVPIRHYIHGEAGEQLVAQPIGVLSRHRRNAPEHVPSRLEIRFQGCADDLFRMTAYGDFPDLNSPALPRRGAPRVSDGLIRIDRDGHVELATPNALSAYMRLGFSGELVGQNLAEVTTDLIHDRSVVDESLPLVLMGRAQWRTDITNNGVIITLRSIPLKRDGERIGAIILSRDVTELRRQEQELLTKDATIREIHHRVKNNLQTVASLLRIQARRSHSEGARDALLQAMRRVSSIAVVHDTLASGLDQNVNFDTVFDRVLKLATEVAATEGTKVYPVMTGSFGTLPSKFATPLALALTELVTNAVEHGLAGLQGEVRIDVKRTEAHLVVVVSDDGVGLPEGKVGSGLGTQIVRTLIEGELGGNIDWHTMVGTGTEVTLTIPYPEEMRAMPARE